MSLRSGRQGIKVRVKAREGWAPHMPAAPAPAPCLVTARPAAVQGYTAKPELSHGSSNASTKGICRRRLTLIQTGSHLGAHIILSNMRSQRSAVNRAQPAKRTRAVLVCQLSHQPYALVRQGGPKTHVQTVGSRQFRVCWLLVGCPAPISPGLSSGRAGPDGHLFVQLGRCAGGGCSAGCWVPWGFALCPEVERDGTVGNGNAPASTACAAGK